MIQHDSFKHISIQELFGYVTEFRTYPRTEFRSTLFYQAVFNHPLITCIPSLSILIPLYPKDSAADLIPFMDQLIKHPLSRNASLKGIKTFMKSFHMTYKIHPCSDHLAKSFYSTLFKMPGMSAATIKDSVRFLRQAPLDLSTLITSFILKLPSIRELSLESILPYFNFFLRSDINYPNSREVHIKFIKAFLSHPGAKAVTPQEALEKFIKPAKGYILIDIILILLSSFDVQPFSEAELLDLKALYLKEIERLEGPNSVSYARLNFDVAVCRHLQKTGQLNEREAQAKIHELVYSAAVVA